MGKILHVMHLLWFTPQICEINPKNPKPITFPVKFFMFLNLRFSLQGPFIITVIHSDSVFSFLLLDNQYTYLINQAKILPNNDNIHILSYTMYFFLV